MRHVGSVQAELLSHPRKGLGGIQGGLGANKESITSQMSCYGTCHLCGEQAVLAYKKNIILIVNEDDLRVT